METLHQDIYFSVFMIYSIHKKCNSSVKLNSYPKVKCIAGGAYDSKTHYFSWKSAGSGISLLVLYLSDGTVEMEVQGSGMMISRLIHRLHNQRFVEITDMETTSIPVKENEFSFRPAN